ncbi:glycosyltransferase family 1 protein [bacterium]|nr:MAG: glycosyltransferase family 1 protein [bacterium]
MKIVFLVDRWSNGGVPTVMETLTKTLLPSNEVIWVFYYEGKQTDAPVRQIELNARFSGDPKALFALKRYLEEENPDIIHDHFGGIWAKSYLFSKWRKKAVLHYHNEFEPVKDSPDDKRTLKEWFFKRMLMPRYAEIVAVSLHNASRIQRYLGKKRNVKVIPNGIVLNQERKSTKQKNEQLVIGFIGRLVFEKGIDSLIEAIAKLEKSNSVKVKIAGDGDVNYINTLHKIVKDKQLYNIEFVGRITDSKSFFSEIDVMYFGSRQEPFGLTIVEAWNNAVPVIGFYPENGGGPFELIQEKNPKAGLLLKKREPKKLAELIEQCISDKSQIEKWSQECEMAVKPFDIVTVISNWEKIYYRVINER